MPRPDRLLVVVDPRRPPMDDDLADLVEHGRGRRVDQGREERHLDHGPVALGDRDEPRDVGLVEIGERVMKRLHDMDPVAYVRFASVYREFKDAEQFIHELKELLAKKTR